MMFAGTNYIRGINYITGTNYMVLSNISINPFDLLNKKNDRLLLTGPSTLSPMVLLNRGLSAASVSTPSARSLRMRVVLSAGSPEAAPHRPAQRCPGAAQSPRQTTSLERPRARGPRRGPAPVASLPLQFFLNQPYVFGSGCIY